MGFLDELSQSLGLFNQGMQQYAVANGVAEAQDKVKQLNATAMDEIEKRAAMQGIANDLTLKLGAIGAPVSQVQSMVGAIAPQPIQSAADAYLQGVTKGDEKLKQIGKEVQAFQMEPALKLEEVRTRGDLQKAMLQMKMTQAVEARRLDKEERQILVGTQDKFNGIYKEMGESIRGINGALKLLESGNKITASAIKPFAARAFGERGNLTEVEKDAFAGKSDLLSRLKRSIETNTVSELPASDIEELKGLMKVSSSSSQDFLNRTAKQMAEQRAQILGSDPEKLTKIIYPDYTGDQVQQQSQQQAPKKSIFKYGVK